MAQTPDIVLFSLMDTRSNDAFEWNLRSHLPTANVLRISSCVELWQKIGLDPPHPRMVIVMDEGIFRKDVDPSFLQIFPYYLHWGGNLVFGFWFITAAKRDIEIFFEDIISLGWTKGEYFSGNFVANQNALTHIPNFSAFPEYYNNLGEHQRQSLDTMTRGILIKDARPHERLYVPCATPEPPSDQNLSIQRPRLRDGPQHWTLEPFTYDIDPTGISTKPLDDDQTILAGAPFDQGYVFLSGNCYYNEQFWRIIEAILVAPKENKKWKAPAKESAPNCNNDGSPNPNKKRKTTSREPPTWTTMSHPGRPGSPSSDPENPWLNGPKPPCGICESRKLECDRGDPCSQCLMLGRSGLCGYPQPVMRWYKGRTYSTWVVRRESGKMNEKEIGNPMKDLPPNCVAM